MVPFKKLALTLAMGGLIAGSAHANSTVSYNYGLVTLGGADSTYNGSDGSYAWTSPAPAYLGSLPINWYVNFDSAGGSASLTSQAALAAGSQQELMVGPQAYRGDFSGSPSANWGHNSDFGLFHISSASDVTITMSSDNSLIGHTFQDNTATPGTPWVGGANTAILAPGFSVWSGWGNGGSRHGAYANNGAINAFANNPLGSGSGVVVIPGTTTTGCNGGGAACAYNAVLGSSSSISTATLTLNNLAAGDYIIFLGGYLGTAGPAQANNHVAYTASISATSVSAVPVPAAVWLFGSSLVGLLGFNRKKSG